MGGIEVGDAAAGLDRGDVDARDVDVLGHPDLGGRHRGIGRGLVARFPVPDVVGLLALAAIRPEDQGVRLERLERVGDDLGGRTLGDDTAAVEHVDDGAVAADHAVLVLVAARPFEGLAQGPLDVGAVVGATYPEELTYLRTLMPHIPFLIPGYGAQGGTAADVRKGFLSDGTGAIVNASRSIIFASSGKDWKEAAGKAAKKMAGELK